MTSKNNTLTTRLNKHPHLRQRVEALLDVVENTSGDCTRADDAEQYVIDELRKMGNQALSSWAEHGVISAVEKQYQETPKAHRKGKKTSAGTAPLEKSQ
jgi:hypothetical protein